MAETQPKVELETVCSLLENEYRRRVLRILETTPRTTRDELTRAIAQDAHRSESVEEISVSLYHTHLPKLADERAIRYDADAETVAITGVGERLLDCLDAMERGLVGGK